MGYSHIIFNVKAAQWATKPSVSQVSQKVEQTCLITVRPNGPHPNMEKKNIHDRISAQTREDMRM